MASFIGAKRGSSLAISIIQRLLPRVAYSTESIDQFWAKERVSCRRLQFNSSRQAVAASNGAGFNIRCYGTEGTNKNFNVDLQFEDFQALLKSGDIQLIDVRERKEIEEHGGFPNAINIPLGELTVALEQSEDDFLKKYGHKKPNKVGHKIVFFCKKGIRSRASISIATQLGFEKSRHYIGGWDDYQKQMGLTSKN